MSAALLLLLLVPLARDLFHDKGRKVAKSQEKKEYLDKFFFFFFFSFGRERGFTTFSRPPANQQQLWFPRRDFDRQKKLVHTIRKERASAEAEEEEEK